MSPPDRPFESVRIMLFATAAAIAYGLIHDQVTAHVCVEYFSVAHPPVFHTRSPFLLALGWGVRATWWVGLPLGVGLALAARVGPRPRLGLGELWRAVAVLMLATGAAALVCGSIGGWMVASGRMAVPGGWGAVLPPAKHAAFAFDAFAHLASYGFGSLGGLVVIGYALFRRVALAMRAEAPRAC